ncbi:MAG: glycerophosphodiester phosphodiesterase family protein, partial [Cyanobacteria bacterium J06600_6]
MLCIGHRGAMGHEPENTLLSVNKAITLGVDAIEIDVYNVENNLVVIHDRDLARTTNGSGYLDRS